MPTLTPTIRPEPKQHLAWQKLRDQITSFIVFGGGAGGGKSWLGCEWLLTNCYLYPGSRWFIGREELKRLMQSTYVTWTKVTKHHGIPASDWKLNGQYNYIEFANGSRIDLLDLKYLPTDPLYERFGSLEYTGGWIEEAGEVNFLAFDVLKSRIGRHMNKDFGLLPAKLLLTCNPNKSWLYAIVYRPAKDGTLASDYAFIQALYRDNRHTAEAYGSQLAKITDKPTRERLMFGNWEYDDDPNALIAYDAIIDLFSNTVDASSEKFLTADVARFGGDFIPIYLWRGLEVYRIEVYRRQGLNVTRERLRQLLADEKIPYSHAIVDENGVGGGLVDDLKGIKGFVAQATPMEPVQKAEDALKEQYANLKTQCSYMLAEAVNKHRLAVRLDSVLLPEDVTPSRFREMLTEDLEQVKRKDADKDGKLKIVGKDDVKERIGRSPDFGDTLMMRMFFELQPPRSGFMPPPTVGLVQPYYPGIGV
jgi:phage terminase large subunit